MRTFNQQFLRLVPSGRKLVIGIPFIWLFLFFMLPFFLVMKISFSEAALSIPPYSEIYTFAEQKFQLLLNIGNYTLLGEDELYLSAYLGSLKVAALSTLMCLVIGFPMAYAITKTGKETQNVLLLLIMMPTWTAILIRVYAWMGILSNNGLLNTFLMWTGLTDHPIEILNTNTAVYIGVVYAYLPFMVLPLYAVLERQQHDLLEAAADLGCTPIEAFWRVTFPLSLPGVAAGSLLCFIPMVGEFVIPDLLGGSSTLMLGKTIWTEFFANRDWPAASAVAIVLLFTLVIPIVLYQRQQAKLTELGR